MAALGAQEPFESWGRLCRAPELIARPGNASLVPALIAKAAEEGKKVLPIGLSRSYGDSGVVAGGLMIANRGLDRFLNFDPESGVLRAEAGVSLDEILRLVVPHGWFLPTTPGTRFVTLGGAIANDVHGKNHHRAGSFGRHVRGLALARSDRGTIEVSADHESDLFKATIGGLGLTGFILWAEIALVRVGSSFVRQEVAPFRSLTEFFALSAQSHEAFEFVSSWIDCTGDGARLGRGVLFRANWDEDGAYEPHAPGVKLSIPIEAPRGLMNRHALGTFNRAYFARHRLGSKNQRVHYTKAFHPLDAIGRWNRLYGPGGFYQHQFVVPPSNQEAALTEALQLIASSGQGSFLSVLKTMGSLNSGGLLSFEGPGTSLALDFPNRGRATLELLERLDRIVVAAGGRIYPAKDARMAAATFQKSYPGWRALEQRRDPIFSSSFWRRVTGPT